MNIISEADLLSIIGGSEERRDLEFKPGFEWNEVSSRKIQEKLIKAMIAMSNIPSGGVIVLGLQTNTKTHKNSVIGITQQHLNSFKKNIEQLQQKVHSHCSQPIDFTLFEAYTNKINSEKRMFIVIKVSEFKIYPTICVLRGKEMEDNGKHSVLEEGLIYTRPRQAPWASKKTTAIELEEIIRLAADKYRVDLLQRGYQRMDSLDVLENKLAAERSEYEQL